MNRKLIFFDIDGTLIGGGSQKMSDSTIRAIKRARQNGHVCVINTGRTQPIVGEEITGQVEFDGILMGCGTQIYYHGEELLHHTFSVEMAKRIIEGLKRHRIDALLEGADDIFCQAEEDLYTNGFRKYMKFLRTIYQFGTQAEAPGNFDKFYAYVDKRETMEAFAEEFQEELTFIDREKGFYEIVPKECSKASAMRFLSDRLQIPMEDTVAIGDSNNDIPMLDCAGVGIAMGNSSGELIAMADYVTTDVGQDGIWNALKWLGVLDTHA
ncbi:MAG: HAD family hydrolase [Lachnospiraceae bacterium]|nr:HAD family hydrolase [Lachnospiraceae bacterium]